MGIELQDSYREQLNGEGIACRERLNQLNREVDTFFLFHFFEHLPNLMQTLREIREKLVPEGEGRIIVEVPPARDFLMDGLALREFIDFTLWSQHLILHTRESLRVFLQEAGCKNIVVTGVQRFGLANHLGWLRHKRPGGHKTNLSIMENDVLKTAYSDALARIDANDTLIAMAST